MIKKTNWFHDLLAFPLSSDNTVLFLTTFWKRTVTLYPLNKSTWNENRPYFVLTLLLFPYPHIALVYMNVCQLSWMFFPLFIFFTRFSLESDRVFLYDLKLEYQAHEKPISIHSRPFRSRSLDPAFSETLPWLRNAGLYSSSECFVTWILCKKLISLPVKTGVVETATWGPLHFGTATEEKFEHILFVDSVLAGLSH